MTRRWLACACVLLSALPAGAAEPMAQGKPLSYWLLMLREPELLSSTTGWEEPFEIGPHRALLALRTLGEEGGAALPELLAWQRESVTRREDAERRTACLVDVLHAIGPEAKPAVPLLLGLHQDGGERVKVGVERALRRIDPAALDRLPGRPTRADVAGLLFRLELEDRGKKVQILETLARIDPAEARVGVPFLCELLMDPTAPAQELHPEVALGRMGPAARDAGPFLAYRFRRDGDPALGASLVLVDPEAGKKALREQRPNVRRAVVRRLAQQAQPRPEIVGVLRDLLDDRDCAATAALALVRFGDRDERLIRRLRELLGSLDAHEEFQAADALIRLNQKHAAVVAPVFRVLLRVGDDVIRAETVARLRSLGKEGVPTLLELLEDPRWWYVPFEALPGLGRDAAAAVPALRKQLDHKDRGRAVRAAWALAWIEPKAVRPIPPAVLAAVKDDNAFVRELALLTLGKLSGEGVPELLVGKLHAKAHRSEVTAATYGLIALGKESVPALVKALGSDDVQTRCNAALVLGEIGPPARAALEALRPLARDREPRLVVRVAAALAHIDPEETQTAARALLEVIRRQDRAGREAALALGRLARQRDGAALMLKEVQEGDAGRRANGALALAASGKLPDSAVRVLTPELKQKRMRADDARLALLLRGVAMLGPTAREAIPAVVELWREETLRGEVEATLAALGKPDPKAFADLDPLLEDRRLRGRVLAILRETDVDRAKLAERLFQLGDSTAAAEFVPSAERVLLYIRHGKWPSGVAAREDAFGRAAEADRTLVRQGGKEVIPKLVKYLDDDRLVAHQSAIYALGLAGEAARAAVPRLVRLGKTADGKTKEFLAVALWELRSFGVDEKDLLLALTPLLASPNEAVRRWAAERLGELGPAARGLSAIVLLLLKDRSEPVRLAAATALGKMGASDKETLARLKELEGPHAVRLAVLEALGRIGPPAKEIVGDGDAILNRLKKPSPNVEEMNEAVARALALARADPARKPAVVLGLRGRLRDDDPRQVVQALAALGSDARQAVPDLIKLHWLWRGTRPDVLEALAAIGPDNPERVKKLAEESTILNAGDVTILKAFGPKAVDAVPALIERIQKQVEQLPPPGKGADWPGLALVETLEAIGPGAREAVPTLLKLHDKSTEARLYLSVARALKKIDPDAARKAGIP